VTLPDPQVLPADARSKKPKRSEAQKRYEVQTQTPSLDGRVTERPRPAASPRFNTMAGEYPMVRTAIEREAEEDWRR
jgi:hypothetical protein